MKNFFKKKFCVSTKSQKYMTVLIEFYSIVKKVCGQNIKAKINELKLLNFTKEKK